VSTAKYSLANRLLSARFKFSYPPPDLFFVHHPGEFSLGPIAAQLSPSWGIVKSALFCLQPELDEAARMASERVGAGTSGPRETHP
jgi:hypothetical protein